MYLFTFLKFHPTSFHKWFVVPYQVCMIQHEEWVLKTKNSLKTKIMSTDTSIPGTINSPTFLNLSGRKHHVAMIWKICLEIEINEVSLLSPTPRPLEKWKEQQKASIGFCLSPWFPTAQPLKGKTWYLTLIACEFARLLSLVPDSENHERWTCPTLAHPWPIYFKLCLLDLHTQLPCYCISLEAPVSCG